MTLTLGNVEEVATLRALLAVAISQLDGVLYVTDDELVGRSAAPRIASRLDSRGIREYWVEGRE